jgi:AraC-like DNA-binding protein/transcriptional regulator with XRE-family HTH domain
VSWRKRLRAAIDGSGRTHHATAELAGVAQATLSRILSGSNAQPAFDTVVRIAHAAGESVGSLLEEDAFVITREPEGEVHRVIGCMDTAAAATRAVKELRAPNAAEQHAAELPREYYRRGARMVFQASGDSMIEAGIVDGDLLFVAPTRAIREVDNRIIVCRVAGKALVKHLELRAGWIHLISCNTRYAPIKVDEDDFHLVGIVIGRLGNVNGMNCDVPAASTKQQSLKRSDANLENTPSDSNFISSAKKCSARGVKSPLCVTPIQRDSEFLETMGYRTKEELERGIAEYLAFCHREKTAARASELATFLNLSYRTLRRLSNRLLGVSVIASLRIRQLEYSANLLRGTELPIDEIGLMAGFGDRGTFFRVIRKHYSCSPTAIRTGGHNRH